MKWITQHHTTILLLIVGPWKRLLTTALPHLEAFAFMLNHQNVKDSSLLVVVSVNSLKKSSNNTFRYQVTEDESLH